MDIYAEISKRQLAKLESGKLVIPDIEGVETTHASGSRAFFFECEGIYAFEAVAEFLDALGINWQRDDE